MSLDKQEHDELEKMVMFYYFSRGQYFRHRAKTVLAWTMIVAIALFLGGMVIIRQVVQPDQPRWVYWIPGLILIALTQIGLWWSKKMRSRITTIKKEIDRQIDEITSAEIDHDEWQLLLRLIAAKDREEAQNITRESMRSPSLSRLTLVRTLYADLLRA